MNIIKTAALIVCTAFLILALCGDISEIDDFTQGININAAMKMFSPDTVMLSSGDLSVPWGVFYFFLHNTASQVSAGFTEPVDWSELFYENTTIADAVKDYAVDQAIQFLVYEYGAGTIGLSLSEDALEDFRQMLEAQVADSGGIANFEDMLRSDGFNNIAVYEEWVRGYLLQERLPAALYGPYFVDISDEVVSDFTERNGFMQAKHILLLTPAEAEGYTQQEIEDAKKATVETLETLLADINNHKNDADFIDYFSALVAQYSEDPGSINYPDGYLFQYPDMVEPFSAACEALEFGQVSGIVETAYGYHIILRLAPDFDNAVPISVASTGQNYTLRHLAVFEDYENRLFDWLESMSIEYAPELESLDIAELYAWHE